MSDGSERRPYGVRLMYSNSVKESMTVYLDLQRDEAEIRTLILGIMRTKRHGVVQIPYWRAEVNEIDERGRWKTVGSFAITERPGDEEFLSR